MTALDPLVALLAVTGGLGAMAGAATFSVFRYARRKA